VAEALARFTSVGTSRNNLNVELIIRVNLFDYTRSDAKNLQHTRCRSAEYDHRQDYNNKDCSTENVAIGPGQACGKRNTDSTTETSPEEHGLV